VIGNARQDLDQGGQSRKISRHLDGNDLLARQEIDERRWHANATLRIDRTEVDTFDHEGSRFGW